MQDDMGENECTTSSLVGPVLMKSETTMRMIVDDGTSAKTMLANMSSSIDSMGPWQNHRIAKVNSESAEDASS